MKRKQNVITFNELSTKVCSLFEENSPVIQKYKDQYQYIFVDEFQDTDPVEWAFVKSFENSSIFCVGDALQSIYGFRGASSEFIKELSIDPDWEVVRLTENYRSADDIVQLANEFSDHADKSYRLDLESHHPGGDIEVHPWTVSEHTPIDESALREIAEDLLDHTDSYRAILCRTNRTVEAIAAFLSKLGLNVSTTQVDKTTEYIINSVRDKEYELNWLSSLLSSESYAQYYRLCMLDDEDTDKELLLFKVAQNNFKIATYIKMVRDIREILKKKNLPPQTRINWILKVLGEEDLEVVYDKSAPAPLGDLILEAAKNRADSAIYIGTIHSSKGLEYDTVYLMELDSKSFKMKSEEEKNLRYVGITRAKTRLLLYSATPEVYKDGIQQCKTA